MKKIFSFLLVIMMLCSISTAAFATTTFEVREADDSWNTDGTELNTPKTELWLQVDASGQIDVTVPLVLVFKTDIDGGTASTATNYKITNNSSAQLAVTKVATAVSDTKTSLVAYNTANLAEDQYKVQLSAGNAVLDLKTAEHTEAAINGGLFTLAKAAANGDGTPTTVTVDMSTGKLSFVTARTADDELDTTKGIKLLTVTYTVAIDTASAIAGDTITDNGDNTVNGQD